MAERCLRSDKRKGMKELNIAFWSEEDGCGTTSGMAAVASVCSNAWNMKTILMQSINQEGDLRRKLESVPLSGAVFENHSYYTLGGLDYLLWQEKNERLDEEMVQSMIVPVGKKGMYYLPSGEGRQRQEYFCSKEQKHAMFQVIQLAGQLSDLTFIDCGSGRDEWSEFLLDQADAVVVNFSQERQALDAYFQNTHVFRGKVVYLINCYSQESIYNAANLYRIYRPQEEIAVIPHNPFFRHAGDKGKLERFIHRHIRGGFFDQQFYFMQELMHTAVVILRAVGFAL